MSLYPLPPHICSALRPARRAPPLPHNPKVSNSNNNDNKRGFAVPSGLAPVTLHAPSSAPTSLPSTNTTTTIPCRASRFELWPLPACLPAHTAETSHHTTTTTTTYTLRLCFAPARLFPRSYPPPTHIMQQQKASTSYTLQLYLAPVRLSSRSHPSPPNITQQEKHQNHSRCNCVRSLLPCPPDHTHLHPTAHNNKSIKIMHSVLVFCPFSSVPGRAQPPQPHRTH